MRQTSIKSILSTWSQKCDTLDIELIIAHILKKDRVFVITNPQYILTKNHQKQITSLCKKRASGYPLAYILGYKEFYSRNFILNKYTLVPRPETEILVEQVIHFISKNKLDNILIIDIGTGSGIIAITLIKELEKKDIKIKIIASDISTQALSIAKQNAKLHEANIKFYYSNLLNNNKIKNKILQENFKNIIFVSNLPYVDIKQKDTLLQQYQSQALRFEPVSALWSNENGLAHYKRLITQTTKISHSLKDVTITSFYEIDPQQSKLFTKYLNLKLPNNHNLEYFKDLSTEDRVAKWSIKSTEL